MSDLIQIPPLKPIPTQAPELKGLPVLRLGFRPFYLLAALFACLAIPLWIAVFLGHHSLPIAVEPLLWHAHEMLFGFGATVIAAFLLTAVKAWTGVQTPRGSVLGALVLLWLSARIAALTLPYGVYAVLDVLFLPAVGILLMQVLIKANNQRNKPLISLLGVMTLVNAAFHLAVLNIIAINPMTPLHLELGLIMIVICVMTGRVVPMFTQNMVPGLRIIVPPRFEPALLIVTAIAILLWAFEAPRLVTLIACVIAGGMHAYRIWLWQSWKTYKRPLLWILHLAYVWMPLGFFLLAAAQLDWISASLGIHAFAVGVMSGLIIGMITRTARGHTGRPLQASKGEIIAYALVLLSAVARVVLPAINPVWYLDALTIAAWLWAPAFAIYLIIYTPWLMQSRLDGKDG